MHADCIFLGWRPHLCRSARSAHHVLGFGGSNMRTVISFENSKQLATASNTLHSAQG